MLSEFASMEKASPMRDSKRQHPACGTLTLAIEPSDVTIQSNVWQKQKKMPL